MLAFPLSPCTVLQLFWFLFFRIHYLRQRENGTFCLIYTNGETSEIETMEAVSSNP